jgi:hypothetical protein
MHVQDTRERDAALAATLGEMTREVGSGRLGSAAVTARLADVAVVRLLRLRLEEEGRAPQGIRGLAAADS